MMGYTHEKSKKRFVLAAVLLLLAMNDGYHLALFRPFHLIVTL
jgi:hypothetical protein